MAFGQALVGDGAWARECVSAPDDGDSSRSGVRLGGRFRVAEHRLSWGFG